MLVIKSDFCSLGLVLRILVYLFIGISLYIFMFKAFGTGVIVFPSQHKGSFDIFICDLCCFSGNKAFPEVLWSGLVFSAARLHLVQNILLGIIELNMSEVDQCHSFSKRGDKIQTVCLVCAARDSIFIFYVRADPKNTPEMTHGDGLFRDQIPFFQ